MQAPEPGAAPAPAGSAIVWRTPGGWIEKPSSPPRLATFAVGDAECTIVSFPGDTGGVAANLRRWLGQLKVEATDERIARLIETGSPFSSEGGFAGTVYDFSAALPGDAQTGMLAAILDAGASSLFVKLMASPALLSAEKDGFAELARSLVARPSGSVRRGARR